MTLLRAAALGTAALLAGCSDGSDGDDFPINPGGGDQPGGHMPGETPDARPDGTVDADPSQVLRGRVCLVGSIALALQGGQCADAAPDGTVVALGDGIVETGPDGAFELPRQPAAATLWRVSGETLYPSLTPRRDAAGDAVLFVVTAASYEATATASGVALPLPSAGSIVLRLLRGVTPVAGAEVSSPLGTSPEYYWTAANTWATGATGASGRAWIPSTAEGVNPVTIVDELGAPSTLDISVGSEAITFVNVALP